MMTIRNRKAFSLVEILIVIMMISAGILPIYSLMRSGQKRIVRADTRTMATLFGTSALELARTLGYDKAQKLQKDNDFLELQKTAEKNGFELHFEPTLQPVTPLPPKAKPMFLLRIKISVVSKHKKSESDVPVLTFVTILTDPRYNFY
ncbi:MAG: type IV pilus modification PilV family protein [Candidatus Rifleibacteriota bacterium]